MEEFPCFGPVISASHVPATSNGVLLLIQGHFARPDIGDLYRPRAPVIAAKAFIEVKCTAFLVSVVSILLQNIILQLNAVVSIHHVPALIPKVPTLASINCSLKGTTKILLISVHVKIRLQSSEAMVSSLSCFSYSKTFKIVRILGDLVNFGD